MIVVIQCAAKKRFGAGYLKTKEGRPVQFVAHPEMAPSAEGTFYARPDGNAGDGQSWRETLLQYNAVHGDNPMGLLPAYRLYANDTYRRLAERFGIENTYILSAGWGLIKASFLTPNYDITFSATAEPYKRRSKKDCYRDLNMLPEETMDEVVFFGGKDYLPLFSVLTSRLRCKRTVYYNSGIEPDAPECTLRRYKTSTRTNWHYECANRFIEA